MAATPSLEDELDKQSIDQLHQAVLQLATNCFETKKLCVTVIISASVLITSFTEKQLDTSFFVAGAIVTAFFWLLDGYNYYYQDKLRSRMKKLAEGMVLRQNAANDETETAQVDGVGMPLSEKRETSTSGERLLRSAFNYSMAFYILLILINILVGLSFAYGLIHTTVPVKSP